MNDIARHLRAQIPSSTDPDRLERMAREAEGRTAQCQHPTRAHPGLVGTGRTDRLRSANALGTSRSKSRGTRSPDPSVHQVGVQTRALRRPLLSNNRVTPELTPQLIRAKPRRKGDHLHLWLGIAAGLFLGATLLVGPVRVIGINWQVVTKVLLGTRRQPNASHVFQLRMV
jgi:hypothetical protein